MSTANRNMDEAMRAKKTDNARRQLIQAMNKLMEIATGAELAEALEAAHLQPKQTTPAATTPAATTASIYDDAVQQLSTKPAPTTAVETVEPAETNTVLGIPLYGSRVQDTHKLMAGEYEGGRAEYDKRWPT